LNRGVAVSFTVKLEVPAQVYILAILAHFFVSPGDAPGAITLHAVWMEREFDAYKLSRSMYPSIFNRLSKSRDLLLPSTTSGRLSCLFTVERDCCRRY